MDITQIFKSTVKMVKIRQISHSEMSSSAGMGDLQIGRVTRSDRGTFCQHARRMARNVSDLRDFLTRNRKHYLAASRGVLSTNGVRLTDAQRDEIDNEAMEYIKLCRQMLSNLKVNDQQETMSDQVWEHQESVLYLLEKYLKTVCQVYSEQKAIRVKRAVDKQILSRLTCASTTRLEPENSPKNSEEAGKPIINDLDNHSPEPVEESRPLEADGISSLEAQLFKGENEQLFNDLISTMDEVKVIEGKVVEISRLQSIFTEKVLEQSVEVERINESLMTSSENVVVGNQDIREAMKNNAGMRVWIIFGICVLSFTLLFLDWYND